MPRNLKAKLPHRKARKKRTYKGIPYWDKRFNKANTTEEKRKVLEDLYKYTEKYPHSKPSLNIKKVKRINPRTTFNKEDIKTANDETINKMAKFIEEATNGKYYSNYLGNFWKMYADMLSRCGCNDISNYLSDVIGRIDEKKQEKLSMELPDIKEVYEVYKSSKRGGQYLLSWEQMQDDILATLRKYDE